MSFFSKFFSGKGGAAPRRDDGLDAEHEAIRRAIERCDALRSAFETGQLSLEDIVATLKRNAFRAPVIRKAIEESLGKDVPDRFLQ